MLSLIRGILKTTTKKTSGSSHGYREQIGGYLREVGEGGRDSGEGVGGRAMGEGKMGEGGQKVQASSYKRRKKISSLLILFLYVTKNMQVSDYTIRKLSQIEFYKTENFKENQCSLL